LTKRKRKRDDTFRLYNLIRVFRTSLTDDYAASNVLCDRLAQRDSSYEDPDLPRKIAADRIEPTSFEELLAHASLPQPREPGNKKSGVRNGIYIAC
jgi:hypothetical protein